MAKKQIKFNLEGFEQVRKSHKTREMLHEIAEDIAQNASDGGTVEGYEVTDLVLEDPRGATSVMATGHAHFDNRKNHTLLRALGEAKRSD